VNVAVVAVASPTKAQAFLEAEGKLPPSVFYCSQDLAAYRTLGLRGKFGAEQEGGNGPMLSALGQGLKRRFVDGEKFDIDMKAFAKLKPFGIVSDTTPRFVSSIVNGPSKESLDDFEAAQMLGGALAVSGGKVMFAHRDNAVSDHVSIKDALAALGV